MKNVILKIGGFFKKAGIWIKNHAPTRRRIIQLYAALLTNANIKGLFNGRIYTGATKNMCVPGLNCYSCPATVGACPLGALQNALASSSTKTPIFMIGILALFGILLGRTICGFLCPTGLIQDLLYKIKSPKLKKNKVTRILSYFKYVLLIALVICVPLAFMLQSLPVPGFCKYICPSGTLGGAVLLLMNPENADMYGMLGGLFTWKFVLLIAILVSCVFIYRPFCRFLCPLGAIYGFFNKIALLGIKVEQSKCVDCGLCVAHCKMDVKKVGDHECINCGECIAVCPTKAIVWKGSSIFVKPNDLESRLDVKVPLTNFVQPATAEAMAGEGADAAVVADMADMMAIEGVSPSPSPAAADTAVARPMKKIPRPYIGPKGKRILEIVLYSAAAILLVAALIYYNAFDKAADNINSNTLIGTKSTDFTVETFTGDEEEYTLSAHSGRVVVLNYWYTSCGPCVAELPHFIEVAAQYKDKIDIVAIHSDTFIGDDIETFITEQGWADSDIIFALDAKQENGQSTYETYGGKSAYPMTVVIDAEGIITCVNQGEMSREALVSAIEDAMN